MKDVFLTLIVTLTIVTAAYSQFDTLDIPLRKEFIKDKEFSGLALSNGILYLLPQHKTIKKDEPAYIYGLYSAKVYEMAHASSKSELMYQLRVELRGLERIIHSNKDLAANYDGLEGISIVGDSCYLLIETRSPASQYGYIIIGHFGSEDGRDVLYLQNRTLPLAKPFLENDLGFEALYFDPSSKKLKVFFEYNGNEKGKMGYEVPLDLELADPINTPHLPFRLTDVSINAQNDVFGINYYWGGEYEVMIRNKVDASDASKATTIPAKKDPNFSFGRIVKLEKNGWVNKGEVPSKGLNWEGIVQYRNGFFLISDDNRNPTLVTKLVFVEPKL